MNKRFYLLIPFLLLSVGCSDKKEKPSEEQSIPVPASISIDSSSEPSEIESSEPVFPPEDAIIQTVSFTFNNGGYFTNNVGLADGENNKATFLTKLNENDGIEDDFFSNITVSGCFFNKYDDSNKITLVIGSSGGSGSLTLHSNYYVKEIKATLQPYFKYDSYNNIYRYDQNSQVTINGQKFLLGSLASDDTFETMVADVTINDFTKDITIKNQAEGQRAMVHSLEISYIANY